MQCMVVIINTLTIIRITAKEVSYLFKQYHFIISSYLCTMGLNPVHNNVKVQLNFIYSALSRKER